MEIGDPRVDDRHADHEPWHVVWSESGTRDDQAVIKAALEERIGATFGDRSFVAPSAEVLCDELHLGDRSFVAAGCLLRDRVHIGDDCSLNPHVTIAGTVRIGDGVRIASHAALFGFNHRFDDLDQPIWVQDLTVEGIVVEDDVWIGTHAVICDGVTVGAHSVIGAGAVVTRDVPAWSVVGGVPARVLRDRRDHKGSARTHDATERFAGTVAAQWQDVLERCRHEDGFIDRPDAPATIRAHCDAVEIAGAFGDLGALGEPAALAERLQTVQEPSTGLFPDPAEGVPDDPLEWRIGAEFHHYGVLSVGYALEVLGAAPLHPVRVVADMSARELVERLDALPWRDLAWPAGSWVDFVGTACYLDRAHHPDAVGVNGVLEALLGWLGSRVDPTSGMWGAPDRNWGWLMPVNGCYRLTRGTYAQFGLRPPHPEAIIDTVTAHARQWEWFARREPNACNVLDVVHPLWWCTKYTDHRAAEIRDHLARVLASLSADWVPGEGFAFERGGAPGLQGTEMWLSIAWHAADAIGEADGLPWRPKGVHRPEPPAAAFTSAW